MWIACAVNRREETGVRRQNNTEYKEIGQNNTNTRR